MHGASWATKARKLHWRCNFHVKIFVLCVFMVKLFRIKICPAASGLELMKTFSARMVLTASRIGLAVLGLFPGPAAFTADSPLLASLESFDYAEPKVFTGTLYEIGSGRKKVLYTFRRTATVSNSTVHVEREFLDTNGSVAAVEKVVYESGRLVSFQMQEFQAQVSGSVRLAPDPKNTQRQQLFIGYAKGLVPPKGDAQKIQPDTLTDDTVYPFMMVHWDELMRGVGVKFHFISLEWSRTFMFRLVKTGESVQDGRMVEQIRMEPTGLLVARLVDPLVFTVEKDSSHRILSYTGRTTPRIRKGTAWKYLDAETVFDWK